VGGKCGKSKGADGENGGKQTITTASTTAQCIRIFLHRLMPHEGMVRKMGITFSQQRFRNR